jgi:hypothetical protein
MPGGAVVADLGDGGHVDGVVELPVTAAVHDVSAGRRFDRGGAVIGGELITAGESVNVTDMAQHRGDDDRTDAVEVGEGGLEAATMRVIRLLVERSCSSMLRATRERARAERLRWRPVARCRRGPDPLVRQRFPSRTRQAPGHTTPRAGGRRSDSGLGSGRGGPSRSTSIAGPRPRLDVPTQVGYAVCMAVSSSRGWPGQ